MTHVNTDFSNSRSCTCVKQPLSDDDCSQTSFYSCKIVFCFPLHYCEAITNGPWYLTKSELIKGHYSNAHIDPKTIYV